MDDRRQSVVNALSRYTRLPPIPSAQRMRYQGIVAVVLSCWHQQLTIALTLQHSMPCLLCTAADRRIVISITHVFCSHMIAEYFLRSDLDQMLIERSPTPTSTLVHRVLVTGFTQPLQTYDYHFVHATLNTTTFLVNPLQTTSTLY